MFNLHRNPDLEDRIFDCLLTSLVAMQAGDLRASFLFVGDLNNHHRKWLDSTTTNRHDITSFNFATVCICNQLVVVPTHARGGTLDLFMTAVPNLHFCASPLQSLTVLQDFYSLLGVSLK